MRAKCKDTGQIIRLITFEIAWLIWPPCMNVTPDRQTDSIRWHYPPAKF